jgi:alpha-tubulin suppressor-like RCC1 family protein
VFIDVSAGGDYGCAVRDDGHLQCWGDNRFGQSSPPSGTFVAVSAGSPSAALGYSVGFVSHACALRADATVACWGDDRFGQASPPLGEFTSVSAGTGFSCGLRPGGTVRCWGALAR